MDQIYVGVDVSKGWIDVSHPTRGEWQVEQQAGALADFAGTMAGEQAVVVMEATGRYDWAFRAALRFAGCGHIRPEITCFRRRNPG